MGVKTITKYELLKNENSRGFSFENGTWKQIESKTDEW
jgi:hypothetical protein